MAQKGCSQQPPPKRGDPGAFFFDAASFSVVFRLHETAAAAAA